MPFTLKHTASNLITPRIGLSRRTALNALAASAEAVALPAFAAWPDKPIKIIVTFTASRASDIVARVMAEQLGKKLGQAVVLDNRSGAGGSVGGLVVTQSPPDGFTLMLSNSTPISIVPFALEKQPYDPVDGSTHIALIGNAPCVVMANPHVPIRTITDVEAQAHNLGQLDFASGGPASIGHIYGELMKKTMGVNLTHIPYREEGAPMTTDLIAGVVPISIDVLTAYVPYFKSGQLVPLAVTSATRSPLVPDVPSVVEFGYRTLILDNFLGLSGSAQMPADVVARLNSACNEILASSDIKKKMLESGITTSPMSPAAFTSFVRDQMTALAPAVKGAGVGL